MAARTNAQQLLVRNRRIIDLHQDSDLAALPAIAGISEIQPINAEPNAGPCVLDSGLYGDAGGSFVWPIVDQTREPDQPNVAVPI